LNKHLVTITLILLTTALLHWSIKSAQATDARSAPNTQLGKFPTKIGSYEQVGEDLEPDENVQRLILTSNILMRHYAMPNRMPIYLTIVHAETVRSDLHQPEFCLVGQGFEIRNQYSAPVGIMFRGKRLVLERGDAKQVVLYWYKTGVELTDSSMLNTWYWTRHKLFSDTPPSSSLVKLSMYVGPAGEEAAFTVLEDFATKLVPVLREELP
jgi:EpsI family protein